MPHLDFRGPAGKAVGEHGDKGAPLVTGEHGIYDGPLIGRRLIRQTIESVERMGLDDGEKKKIFQDNAIKLLRLPLGFPLSNEAV